MPTWLAKLLDIADRVGRRVDPLVGPAIRGVGALTGWGSRRLAWRLWLSTVALTGVWLTLRGRADGLTGDLLFDAAVQGAVTWATLLLLGSALATPADRRSVAGTVLRFVAVISVVTGLLGVLGAPGAISMAYLGRSIVEIGAAWAATTRLPEGRVRVRRPVLLPALARVRR
ncbi:MAG: hypothetical protein AAGF02_15360 [Actinomycetota bacterium]